MTLDLTPALLVFLGIGIWYVRRAISFLRRRGPRRSSEPFPNVGTAPPIARPVTVWRYNDDGLGMYSHHLPTTAAPAVQVTTTREPDD